jgi:methionyl-tRNA formyltransferase
MKKIFFLLNKKSEFDFQDLIERYLSDCSITIGERLPDHSDSYDLIVLWNYRKILRDVAGTKNIILFHSSDLPEGKGWAPIYHAISEGREWHVISGVFAGSEVDSGDIIVKAKFRIRNDHTAGFIRKWDAEISIRLVGEILGRFAGREIQGMKQFGAGSFRSRRKPEDNEISLDARLGEIVDTLRACEKAHPAFFLYKDAKYRISLEPWEAPEFPKDLQVVFYDS